MRAFLWLALVGAASVAGALVFTLGYVVTYAPPDDLPEASAIVAISGPGAETAERTARAVELYLDGRARLLVLSGGTGAAANMKAQALAAGVRDGAILIEDASRSTLQNGLFVRDLGFDAEMPILLVTHRYHLPRARASFRWAGFRDVTPVAADAGTPVEIARNVLMEGVKWPVNIVRAAFGSAAMSAGLPRERWIGWLN